MTNAAPPQWVTRRLNRWALRPMLNGWLPFPAQRAATRAAALAIPVPRGTVVEKEILGGVQIERIRACDPMSRAASDLTVVYLHGGGYCVGSPAMARSWAGQLARAAGVEVVVPEYRLAPEHPYPAAIEDVVALWAAASERGAAVLAGDSAGAGLALTLATRLRDSGAVTPKALVLLSPWLDLQSHLRADPIQRRRDPVLTSEWLARCAEAYAAGRSLADPDLSPLHHDLRGLPQILVQAGADDLLAPDLDLFGERLAAATVTHRIDRRPGLWHDFALYPGLIAAADDCLLDVVALLCDIAAAVDGAPNSRGEAIDPHR